MCGRYALALRPSQVMRMLADDNMPVSQAPSDDEDDSPRQSYNFAPGYHGIVYRATIGSESSAQHSYAETRDTKEVQALDGDPAEQKTSMYMLQSMKWGLIPFWTKRNPDYSTIMRTINCRDDSLATPGGMWTTMKARKRCVVIAQGFYEWLNVGPKNKLPHFIKRKDGHLMCFAGLWDCVQFEDSDVKTYSYTIITTDANKQMKFIHDRMPVVLEPGSGALRTWLDPNRKQWTRELQSLLKPFQGELDIYPVSKDVGKISNDSASFIIPVDSKDNKSNIANFFRSPLKHGGEDLMENGDSKTSANTQAEASDFSVGSTGLSVKRKSDSTIDNTKHSTKRSKLGGPSPRKISAISNQRDETKSGVPKTPKITSFFKK